MFPVVYFDTENHLKELKYLSKVIQFNKSWQRKREVNEAVAEMDEATYLCIVPE